MAFENETSQRNEEQLVASDNPVQLPNGFLPFGAGKKFQVRLRKGSASEQPVVRIRLFVDFEIEIDEVPRNDQSPSPSSLVALAIISEEVGELLVEVKETPGGVQINLLEMQVTDDEVIEKLCGGSSHTDYCFRSEMGRSTVKVLPFPC